MEICSELMTMECLGHIFCSHQKFTEWIKRVCMKSKDPGSTRIAVERRWKEMKLCLITNRIVSCSERQDKLQFKFVKKEFFSHPLDRVWFSVLQKWIKFKRTDSNRWIIAVSILPVGLCRIQNHYVKNLKVNIRWNFVQMKQWCAWETINAAPTTKKPIKLMQHIFGKFAKLSQISFDAFACTQAERKACEHEKGTKPSLAATWTVIAFNRWRPRSLKYFPLKCWIHSRISKMSSVCVEQEKGVCRHRSFLWMRSGESLNIK